MDATASVLHLKSIPQLTPVASKRNLRVAQLDQLIKPKA